MSWISYNVIHWGLNVINGCNTELSGLAVTSPVYNKHEQSC